MRRRKKSRMNMEKHKKRSKRKREGKCKRKNRKEGDKLITNLNNATCYDRNSMPPYLILLS